MADGLEVPDLITIDLKAGEFKLVGVAHSYQMMHLFEYELSCPRNYPAQLIYLSFRWLFPFRALHCVRLT